MTTPHPTGAQVAHTPTPWLIIPPSKILKAYIRSETGIVVLWLDSCVKQSDRELIVEACNAHATLTAELAALRERVDSLTKALEVEEAACEAWDNHRELLERSCAEGWDNDPTGCMHVASSSSRASELTERAIGLRRTALSETKAARAAQSKGAES